MKHLKSIFPFAFCLLALAGCSNDESEADNSLNSLKSGDMIVTLEELTSDEEEDGLTRSFMSRDLKNHLWVEDDEMRVYGPYMTAYDIYKFSYKDESRYMGVFTQVSSFLDTYGQAPSFALFANQDVKGGYFDRDAVTNEPILSAQFIIGVDTMKWESCQSNGKAYFTDWLPRWGQVTEIDGNGVLHASLKFLTGVLRLQLANTAGKADLLKIQMFKDNTALNIAGFFKTVVSDNYVIQPTASLAQDTYKRRSGGTDMFVDLTGATGSVVVFVPLVTTTEPVDIVVSASNDNGETWTEFKRFKNKIVKRGVLYGNANEYAF